MPVSPASALRLSGTPGRVTNLIAQAGDGYIDARWDPPVDHGASSIVGFQVAITPGTISITVSDTMVRVPNIDNGTRTVVRVAAINGSGIGPSVSSKKVTAGPAVSITDAMAMRNRSGSGTASLSVTLDSPAVVRSTVRWATQPGTAFPLVDYLSRAGRAVFEIGQSSVEIRVPIVSGFSRPDVAFKIVLSKPQGIVLGDDTAKINIRADALPNSLSISNSTVSEGDAGDRVVNLVVSLSEPSSAPVSVNFATQPTTANPGVDYEPMSGTLMFAKRQQSSVIPVVVHANTEFDSSRMFEIVLSSALGATLQKSSGTISIVDDDYSSNTGDFVSVPIGSTTMNIAVRLSGTWDGYYGATNTDRWAVLEGERTVFDPAVSNCWCGTQSFPVEGSAFTTGAFAVGPELWPGSGIYQWSEYEFQGIPVTSGAVLRLADEHFGPDRANDDETWALLEVTFSA